MARSLRLGTHAPGPVGANGAMRVAGRRRVDRVGPERLGPAQGYGSAGVGARVAVSNAMNGSNGCEVVEPELTEDAEQLYPPAPALELNFVCGSETLSASSVGTTKVAVLVPAFIK